jgi:N-acyl-D-aspartate/D-glutamate deacylase
MKVLPPGIPFTRCNSATGVRIIAVLLGLFMSTATFAASTGLYDLVLSNGRVMDPESGLNAIRNIGISDGTIRNISENPLKGTKIIDLNGLVVAPGFIDLNGHGQDNKSNEYQAMDGVTTVLETEAGTPSVDTWYKAREGNAVLNFGATVSHPYSRMVVMAAGNANPDEITDEQWNNFNSDTSWSHNEAGQKELDQLIDRLEQGLEAGALGIGTATQYTPGSRRYELYKIFQLAATYEVTVFSHVRYGSAIPPDSINAVQEMIANSATTGASTHVFHINSTGVLQTGELLEMIDGASQHGVKITTDVYPYTAANTFIGAAIFDEGWQDRLGISYDGFQWALTGERLNEETFYRYRKEQPGEGVIIHFMKPELVKQAVAHPQVAIASDGLNTHPRGAGTFARVLGHYVREQQALPLMTAIRKMTLIPAQILETSVPQMKNKGRISVGADADITVFNPETIIDHATFEDPMQYSKGVEYVLVSGIPVVSQGSFVKDVYPGEAVRRPQR